MIRSTAVPCAALLAGVLACAAGPARGGDPAPSSASPPAVVLVAADAKQPSVAIDAQGNVFIVCLRGGNVVVLASKDRGATFGEPCVAIDAKGRARGGRQRGPRIGVSPNGLLAVTAPVTFDEAEAGRRYPTAELYLTTSADAGATWTAPLRVNEVEKAAPESLHAMAVAADGTVHVAWLDRRARKEKGQDLWYTRVSDGQAGPNLRIAEQVCECCAPGIALDGAGNPRIAWRDGGDAKSREIFAATSADGGRTFGKRARLNRGDTNEHT